jgi:putative phosphoesterase
LKVAVISDIHSNLDALKAVIGSLPSYDFLLCLGDIVGYGPQPDNVIEELRRLQPKMTIMGNHDYAVTTGDVSGFSLHAAQAVEWTRQHIRQENTRYLSALNPTARTAVEGKRVVLFHGSPSDPLSEYIFPGIPQGTAEKLAESANADIVLLGHTHVPMAYSLQTGLLANPGSVGQPRDGDPRASFAILTISENEVAFDVTRTEYDVDSVANKIRRAGLPRFLADRLYTGM